MSDPTKPTVEQIEADIVRSRAQLAGTVDELAGRLDVKGRMKDKVQQTKQDTVERVHAVRAKATDDDGRPTPPAIAGAVVAVVLVGLVVWWRTRR